MVASPKSNFGYGGYREYDLLISRYVAKTPAAPTFLMGIKRARLPGEPTATRKLLYARAGHERC
jgi:hypothetical protein